MPRWSLASEPETSVRSSPKKANRYSIGGCGFRRWEVTPVEYSKATALLLTPHRRSPILSLAVPTSSAGRSRSFCFTVLINLCGVIRGGQEQTLKPTGTRQLGRRLQLRTSRGRESGATSTFLLGGSADLSQELTRKIVLASLAGNEKLFLSVFRNVR